MIVMRKLMRTTNLSYSSSKTFSMFKLKLKYLLFRQIHSFEPENDIAKRYAGTVARRELFKTKIENLINT